MPTGYAITSWADASFRQRLLVKLGVASQEASTAVIVRRQLFAFTCTSFTSLHSISVDLSTQRHFARSVTACLQYHTRDRWTWSASTPRSPWTSSGAPQAL